MMYTFVLSFIFAAPIVITALIASAFSWPVRANEKRFNNRVLMIAAQFLNGAFASLPLALPLSGILYLGSPSSTLALTSNSLMLVILFAITAAIAQAVILLKLVKHLLSSRQLRVAIESECYFSELSCYLLFASSILGVITGGSLFTLIVGGIILLAS